jgi:hypothetical protein
MWIFFLILLVWCSESLLFLDDSLFSEIGEIFCYYIIEEVNCLVTRSSSIPIIHKLGLLMLAQRSYMLRLNILTTFHCVPLMDLIPLIYP